jgi:hypothetical protein
VTRSVGARLPDPLLKLLSGKRLDDEADLAFMLLTVRDDGWPHAAMLSLGELAAPAPHRVRLALWPGSRTTANLTRDGRATLALVHEAAGWYVRGSAERGEDLLLSSGQRLAAFEMSVEEVLVDEVAYAVLTSGISFRLREPQQVLPRWRETIDALLATRV